MEKFDECTSLDITRVMDNENRPTNTFKVELKGYEPTIIACKSLGTDRIVFDGETYNNLTFRVIEYIARAVDEACDSNRTVTHSVYKDREAELKPLSQQALINRIINLEQDIRNYKKDYDALDDRFKGFTEYMADISECVNTTSESLLKDYDNMLKRQKENEAINSMLSTHPGSKICPSCNGKGYMDGSDGFDIFNCPTCKGHKIVYVKEVTKTVYEPVEN